MIIAGKYEVLETIGRGGMGTVYKARQKSLDRVVAIKMLSEELAADHEFRARFQQEATVVARLNHPNIVQVHDIEPHGETFCIIMEYVEGENLQAKIDRDVTLPEKEAVLIGAQVARALDYAHRHGIVHRDIKPDNIHVTPAGVAKVMDFGIARFVDSNLKTQTGISMGTPKFMSPEQVTGKNVDGQTDLYSLGICLYYCLAGRPPFDGENAISVATRHLYEQPELPSRINSSISHEVEKVIMKALEKQKPNRYRTGVEMADALEGTQGISSITQEDATVAEAYAGVTQRIAVGQYGVELTASDFSGGAIDPESDDVPVPQPGGPSVSPLTVRTLPRAEDLTPSRPVEEPDDPTTSFKFSLKVLVALMVVSLLIIFTLVFVLQRGNGASVPDLPGSPASSNRDANAATAMTQAKALAENGKIVEAYNQLSGLTSKELSKEIEAQKALLASQLPLSETTVLANRREALGRHFLNLKPPKYALSYVYYNASAKLGADYPNVIRDLLTKLPRTSTDEQRAEAEAALQQGLAYSRAGNTKEAEESLLEAANLDYFNPRPWAALGDFYAAQRRHDDARIMYSHTLELPIDATLRQELQQKLQQVNG